MPNTDEPKLAEWLKKIKEVVKISDEETYFVGHSLGAITILRYIEKLSVKEKVGGVVLVAGLITAKKNKLSDFIKNKLDYKKIKSHITKKIVAIHSDNDPVVL